MSRSAWGVGLAAGAAFGLLAAPGLTWLDGGELAAASAELGVAHPPGFPLFSLICKGVMLALPVGDVAFRGNVASGLLAAAAAVMVVAAARAWGVSRGAAAAGAGLWAVTPVVVLHATTVEVYAGAGLWTAAVLWGVARARDDGRAALTVGLLCGLAAGHHAELRLLVGVAMVAGGWAWWRAGEGRMARRAALGAAVMAGLGALVVLYLPVRAAGEPWRNWGDPSSVGGLWDHLMGARIRAAYAAQFGHVEGASVRLWAEQWVVGAPVLCAAGLWGLGRLARGQSLGWTVAAVAAVDAVYSVALNPMGLADMQNGVVGAVALAVGAAAAFDRAGRALAARGSRLVGVAGAGVVAAGALWAAPRWELYTGDRGLGAAVAEVGDALPPEALVAVASDNLAAGSAYAQVVEGLRPDLAVVVRQHVGYASSVGPVARRLPAAVAGWSPGVGLGALERLGGAWPLGWEGASELDAEARPQGLLPRFPLLVRGARALDGPLAAPLGLGRQGRRAWASWLSDRGRFELRQGRAAARWFEAARVLEPDRGLRWNNLATALAGERRYAEARAAAEEAVARAPDDALARLNLARYALHAGDAARAAAVLDALVEDAPSADALALRGVVRGNGGDLAGAAADFEAALRLDPRQPEARAGIEQVRRLRAAPPR